MADPHVMITPALASMARETISYLNVIDDYERAPIHLHTFREALAEIERLRAEMLAALPTSPTG